MSDKWKSFLSIFIFTLSFFMMVKTRYIPALGDLVLEMIGLNAWTNGDSGFHVTIVYFGVLAFISYIYVRRYASLRAKMKSITIFLIFVALMTSFTYMTSATAQYIKKQSEGVFAIALVEENNKMTYKSLNNQVTDFEIDVTLKNYGNEALSFFMDFDNQYFEEEEAEKITILSADGTKALFEIKAGKTVRFKITSEDYLLTGGVRGSQTAFSGSISEVILTDLNGESVIVSDESVFSELRLYK